MSALQAGFPNAPLVDPAGNIVPVWRSFMLAIFARTGAGPGVSSGDTAAALTAETAARAAADTSLGGAISNEATARAAAMTAEAAIRAAADAALGVRIAALGTVTFTQATPAAVWHIMHHLGRFPAVEVVDSAGHLVEGDVVFIPSNNLTVTFSGVFSGVAYLN